MIEGPRHWAAAVPSPASTFAELLEDAVLVMRRRLDRMRGLSRLHAPTTRSR